MYSHKAWHERDLSELKYPLLADFTKEISRGYGVLNEDTGFANRGTFIIDPKGVVQFEVVTATGVGRNTDDILRTLDALQSGGACPVNWKKGDPNL